MAITPLTLREARRLVLAVGGFADEATRLMATRWVDAWTALEPLWITAVENLIAARDSGGELAESELMRARQLLVAIARTQAALAELIGFADPTAVAAARAAAAATRAGHPEVMASQLPPDYAAAAMRGYIAATSLSAVDAMVARTAQTIHALMLPLPDVAIEAIRRVLVETIVLGLHPTTSARQLVRELRGAFDLSLTRAVNIVRTETLDTYRRTAALVEQGNADVLSGWRWWSALDARTCPGCWGKHGTLYPTAVPGPWDHQQGRCARVPELRPWAMLGIPGVEPAPVDVDARKVFATLPKSDQLAIMGPTRLAGLDDGTIPWSALARRRKQRGWRDSFAATPVGILTDRE